MKAKILDYETDWEKIKEEQLSFLLAEQMPGEEDIREIVLSSVMNMAPFN